MYFLTYLYLNITSIPQVAKHYHTGVLIILTLFTIFTSKSFAQKIDLNKQKNQNHYHNTESISKYINKKTNAQFSSVPQDNLKYNGVSKSQARLAFVIDDINRSKANIEKCLVPFTTRSSLIT